MTKVENRSSRWSGKRITLIVAGAVVLVLVVTALVIAGVRGAANNAGGAPAGYVAGLPTPDPNSPAPPSATPSPKPSTGAKSSTGAKPSAPKVDARYGAAVAQVVGHGTDAKLSGGMTAKITDVTATDAKAVMAGQTAGSAIKVTIDLANTTGRDVSLAQVAVNAYYGSKSTPAIPLTDGATPFLGSLAAGKTMTGTYVFTVPTDQQSSTVITMTDSAGTPITVFK
jgi:hypothetical protein